MTQEECEFAYGRITAAMRTQKLEWLVAQVEEKIRFGRPLTKKVRMVPEEIEDLAVYPSEGPARRARQVLVTATRPYTNEERLRILIEALQHAIVERHDMEDVVRRSIHHATKTNSLVALVRADAEGAAPIHIPPEADAQRTENVRRLSRTLQTLRERI